MKLLFDDRLAPITSEYGFIECSVEDAVAAFCKREESAVGSKPVNRLVLGRLENLLKLLEPLTTVERRRVIFVPTRSSWVAYFDNGARGTDAATLSFFALELGCRATRLVAIPDSLGSLSTGKKKGRYGATIFELYGPRQTHFLNYVRSVGVVNDGGRWSFDQAGDPLSFENVEAYRAAAIRDRFRLESLDHCFQALGIRAFDPDFFLDQGVLVERTRPLLPQTRELSLIQARTDLGLAAADRDGGGGP